MQGEPAPRFRAISVGTEPDLPVDEKSSPTSKPSRPEPVVASETLLWASTCRGSEVESVGRVTRDSRPG